MIFHSFIYSLLRKAHDTFQSFQVIKSEFSFITSYFLRVYCKNTLCCYFATFPHRGIDKNNFSLSSRASRELDGHQGDPPGGHGVPAQVPGGHHGGAAQRGGAFCSRRQEDRGHGKEETTSPDCHHTQSSLVEKPSAWLPTASLVASSRSEDAISLDTVSEFMVGGGLIVVEES